MVVCTSASLSSYKFGTLAMKQNLGEDIMDQFTFINTTKEKQVTKVIRRQWYWTTAPVIKTGSRAV